MLTIGRLASAAGVSVRTVRHYHAIGLLPEPARDASGYRSYPARTVAELIRIRTLADAGVPLARVAELLSAPAEEFRTAIEEIDQTLARRIRELEQHRRHIRGLLAGDDLVLDPQIVHNLERLRELGVSERVIDLERDAWILMSTLDPAALPQRIGEKTASFDDPEATRLYLAMTDAMEWDRNDERLRTLANDIERWEIAFERSGGTTGDTATLIPELVEESPALQQLLIDLAQRRRDRTAS